MNKSSLFKIGWLVGIAGAFVPLFVGLRIYARYVIPSFISGEVTNFITMSHVISNLLTGGAIATIVICYFGIRKKLRWCWYLHLFGLAYVGSGDLIAMLRASMFPKPIIPMTLGVLCLILTAPLMFADKKS